MSPLAQGAVAAAQKHPEDALLQAAARVVQTQAAPVKKDKPVSVAADGKKTAGRQALKAKQWLEHKYRQECIAEGLCPHCGTVYADRPASMLVPYSHAACCQASAELVIEYANMTACGIPMHRSDVICGSDTVEQLATENFGRPVQMWATDGIGGILTEQIKAVDRQAEYVGAVKTKFPVLEKASESGTAHLLVCSTNLEQERLVTVYECMPSRQGQSLAAHLKNWQFRVLTRDGSEGYTSAFREQELESRDIVTQVCLVHARGRICNAVNIDHFADITSQDDGALLATSRFEEHSPQYLLCMALAALSKR